MIKEKNILFILISSTIVALAWVAFSIYHTAISSTLDEELTVQIKPIRPRFSSSALSEITERNDVEATYQMEAAKPSTASAALSPTVTPSPTKTPSVTPKEEQPE